mgnify:CR=1 FL=1
MLSLWCAKSRSKVASRVSLMGVMRSVSVVVVVMPALCLIFRVGLVLLDQVHSNVLQVIVQGGLGIV